MALSKQMTHTLNEQIRDQILDKFLQVETFFPRSFVFTMLLPANLNIVDAKHKN